MGGGDGICYRTARRAQKAPVVLLKQVEKGEGRKEEGKKGVIIGIQPGTYQPGVQRGAFRRLSNSFI